MLEPTFSFASTTISTYSLLVSLSILVSTGLILFHTPRSQRREMMDLCLAGTAGGLLFARLLHTALHWNYFKDNTWEILQFRAGGLDWHGALIGTLLAMALLSRWRRIDFGAVLPRFAWVLPWIAFASWWGCSAVGCAYGRDVASLAEYPSLAVWEGPDIFGLYAPRFFTQLLGMAASALLFVVWIALRRHRHRFWILVAGFSVVMFGIGFLRGDDVLTIGGIRLDQMLDMLIFAFALVQIGTAGHSLRILPRNLGKSSGV